MPERIEDAYFRWLCAKVLDRQAIQTRNSNYHDLLRILYGEEFVVFVHGDHNRADDGKELRIEFLAETGCDPDTEPFWFDQPCSVLEMLIAFSRRAEFQTDIPVRTWFWKFLDNLGLTDFRRINGHGDLDMITDVLHTFIWRTYRPNGQGGMLPMRSPRNDQRKVEIWAQFFEYLNDQGI